MAWSSLDVAWLRKQEQESTQAFQKEAWRLACLLLGNYITIVFVAHSSSARRGTCRWPGFCSFVVQLELESVKIHIPCKVVFASKSEFFDGCLHLSVFEECPMLARQARWLLGSWLWALGILALGTAGRDRLRAHGILN
ncbi:MAG TPA: hypothetical protein VGE95_06440, partial [Arthrobacter sp.]